jgi:hypothetical protein
MFTVRIKACACLFLIAFGDLSMLHAQLLKPSASSTNGPPKAAATVNLVYDAAQADIYYIEMRIDQTTDNSFFVPCGWENGYFGLQQFNGENKRAFNFAVSNPLLDPADEGPPDNPVEVVYSDPRTIVKRLPGRGGGVQGMREFHWRVGETYRFAIQAQVQTNNTAYTAWLFDPATSKWQRIATFRALTGGRWLRGYYSYIEDFRRDFKSAKETRRASFGNIWIHQDKGTYNPVRRAMFTISALRTEAHEAVDAGELAGFFTLATGGKIHKSRKVGSAIVLSEVPLRKPEPPDLPFLYERSKP